MNVIEAPHYDQEVASLMRDPIIARMAMTYIRGIQMGDISKEWIQSSEAMNVTNDYARKNGVVFTSLGNPVRAISSLVEIYFQD